MTPLILIADDDEGVRQILSIQLGDAGYRTVEARDGLEAMHCFREQQPDLVLTDLRMPYKDGQALLESILRQDAQATVVLMSAYATVERAVEVMKTGAFDFLVKPFKEEEVLACVERALKLFELKRENRELKQVLAQIGGEPQESVCPNVRAVFEQGRSVADTDAVILISGETGTGKEYLAYDIHRHSPRRDRPWVVVNCGALPENLVEAELFGHTRGAFTGAVKARQGRIHAADGGTLFLDEIGDLPLDAQVKLLRFLQEGEIQAVGADRPVKVDARIIAATHRDLQEMVREGRFREDLYYRLNVISLRLPRLAERRKDIAILADRFLVDAAAHHGRQPSTLSKDALSLLESYAWPGNVRQLKNLCERWALIYPGSTLSADEIGPDVRAGECDTATEWKLPPEGVDLEMLDKSLIRQAMAQTGGNKSAAARLLGITRHTLDYRIEKYALDTDHPA